MQESTINLDPTEGFNQFWTTARHRQSIVLGVKAAGGIKLYLSPILGMTEPTYGYELSLKSGANSKSYIRYAMFCSLPLIFMRQA